MSRAFNIITVSFILEITAQSVRTIEILYIFFPRIWNWVPNVPVIPSVMGALQV